MRCLFLLCVVLFGCHRMPDKAAATETAMIQSLSPRAGDERLTRGPVILESVALSSDGAVLTIVGTLPNPCHELRVSGLDARQANGDVPLEAWSVADPSQMCAQMLQPFSVQLPVKPGARITVNGQPVGK